MSWVCDILGCAPIILAGEMVEISDEDQDINISTPRDVEICKRCYSRETSDPSEYPLAVEPISVDFILPRIFWARLM